jgi:hypothetical protein
VCDAVEVLLGDTEASKRPGVLAESRKRDADRQAVCLGEGVR